MNYTYNVDFSMPAERDKATFEREYHEAAKVLDSQKRIFEQGQRFDPQTFNKLFEKNQAEAKKKREEPEQVQELVSGKTPYTELDSNITNNISNLNLANYDIYEQMGSGNPTFSKEEIQRIKKEPSKQMDKLSKSEMDKLISQRNSAKMEYNTEKLSGPLSYDYLPNGEAIKKQINSNPVKNYNYNPQDIYNMGSQEAPLHAHTHMAQPHAQPTNVFNGQYTAPQPQQNQYMNIQDLIIQIKDYEIKELKMRQEIDKLRQDNNKLKAMVKKLQKQQ